MQSDRLVIAAQDTGFRTKLKQLFNQSGYVIVGESNNFAGTLRLLQGRKPDLVVIDGESPEMNVPELLHVIETDKIAPVVVITSKLQRHLVNKAKQSWYFSYVMKPFTDMVLLSAIEIALANYQRIMEMEREILVLKETLATRKVVDKAKGILIEQLNISESEAYKRIRKKSMDKCKTMQEVANGIILAYE